MSDSRYRLEVHTHAGGFLFGLPYKDVQYEQMLGSAGDNFRASIPYRGVDWARISTSSLLPGKSQLYWYDENYDTGDPVFAGPMWDMTASSGSGLLSVAAQDPMSILRKRLNTQYTSFYSFLPVDIIYNLVAYTNGIYGTNINVNRVASGTDRVNIIWKAADLVIIADAIEQVAAMGAGIEYFWINIGGQHYLQLYYGGIQYTSAPLALEYGAQLDNYSVQYNAQTIANENWLVGSSGQLAHWLDTASESTYNMLFQAAGSSELTDIYWITVAALQATKDTKNVKVIPSIVTHSMVPRKDFNFGTQFRIVVDDFLVQIDQVLRVVGWQNTVGANDDTTTVIYTKDTDGL